MECPSESTVAAFVGGVGSFPRGVVEDHVDDCAACRVLLAGLVRTEAADPRAWRNGLRVGRYVVGEAIGRGGMGAVWRAEDVELGRAVALKRLHTGGRERLVREARTAAQLQHPNVVAVYEVVDPSDSAPFLAMELVDGVTLTAWLRDEVWTWREIVAVLVQAGRGLAAAHERGLVHRDFKPDNVLVDRSGRARVADFGLASSEVVFDAGVATSCKLARVTASAAGTPAYMAPELVDGAPPDVRSDVYAFAVALYEALHGQHPFAGTTVETIWLDMAAGRVRPNARRIPHWLDRAVRRGLAVDPAERWPDMASFVTAIDRQRGVRRYAIAAAIAGFGAAAGAALLVMPDHGTDACAFGAARADRVWNPRTRAVVTARLVAAAPDATAAATAVKLVDGWTMRWQIDRRDACVAGENKAARAACLDRELDELGVQLATWSSGAAGVQAINAAAALPAPLACDSAAASGDPIARTLDLRVTELRTLWNNGRGADARGLVPALLRDVEASGNHATRARAFLVASMIENEQALPDAAAHVMRAVAEAGKAGDDATLYSALVQRAYVLIDGGQPADALGICDAADALALRGVANPEKVVVARAGALMRLGRTPEAIAQYERAIAMLEPAAHSDTLARISLSVALAGLGNAYLESRDSVHAIERQHQALALQEVDYGPRHPEVARTLHDLAQAEESARDFEGAVRDFQRARAIQVAAFGEHHPEVGEIDVALATIAARTGAIDDARAMFDRAREELGATLRPTHQIFAVIEGQLGSLEQNADHAAAAIPHYERAYAILVANHAGGDDLARVDIDWSTCLLDVGRLPEAKAKAEETIEQLTRAGMGDHEKSTARMVLALIADERGDRATAIALAKQVVAATGDDDRGQIGEARKIVLAKLREWHVNSAS